MIFRRLWAAASMALRHVTRRRLSRFHVAGPSGSGRSMRMVAVGDQQDVNARLDRLTTLSRSLQELAGLHDAWQLMAIASATAAQEAGTHGRDFVCIASGARRMMEHTNLARTAVVNLIRLSVAAQRLRP